MPRAAHVRGQPPLNNDVVFLGVAYDDVLHRPFISMLDTEDPVREGRPRALVSLDIHTVGKRAQHFTRPQGVPMPTLWESGEERERIAVTADTDMNRSGPRPGHLPIERRYNYDEQMLINVILLGFLSGTPEFQSK